MRYAALLVVCAACGRVGFDATPQDAAGNGDAPTDAAPDAPQHVLACGPTGVVAGAAQWSTLHATSTTSGYIVVGETTGTLAGWAFGIAQAGDLHVTTSGVALAQNATDNANMGLAARGDSLVLAALIGRPDATGALRGAFDPELVGTTAIFTGEIPAPIAEARGPNDDIAYLTVQSDTELDVQLLDDSAALAGEKTIVADSSEHTGDAAIASAGGGFYVASWTENSVSPNTVRVKLVGGAPSLPVTAGSTLNTMYDESHARVAWNEAAQRYLVTWTQKTETMGDEIWFDIRDANLTEVVVPTRVEVSGYGSKVIADRDGFLLAFNSNEASTHVGAARISPSGQVGVLALTGSGGTAIDYDVVSHGGQSAVVWAEANGSGSADLWFDPLCVD